jgi:putative phosphoserine phosphatase/1-acylglycerol-3-phosphate O-acyltransferase
MAQQAGVPVVPIVLRGTGALMPPGSLLVHSGTVHAAVLEPVDVSGWPDHEFHERAEAVRQCFVDALDC